MAMGIIDSIMIGRLGSTPLAASSFANGVIVIFLVFGIGTANVVGPLMSQLHGEKKVKECGGLLICALVLFLVFGLGIVLIIEILGNNLQLFKQPPEVTEMSREFYRIMGLSVPFALIFQCYKQFIEAYGKSGRPMQMLLWALIINVVINWFLIYGNGPFPKLGLVGAGIGTFCARLFLVIVIIYHVHTHSRYKEGLESFKRKYINLSMCKQILRVGIPSGAQVLFEVGAFVFGAIMMGWLGAKALAAHQIAIGVASCTFMCALGISLAGGLRVSLAKGIGDYRAVRRSGHAALLIITVIMGSLGLLMFAFRHQIPHIYIEEVDVVELASQLLLIAVVFQIFDGIQCVGMGLLRGILDMRVPTFLALFSYIIVCIPFAYFCGFILDLGAQGIWIGLLTGLVVASILLVTRFEYITRKRLRLDRG